MKKALKRIFAVVASSAMAMSVFSVAASAADTRGYWDYNGNYISAPYYVGDVVLNLTAQNYYGGTITASVSKPAGVTITGYTWTGSGIATPSSSSSTSITAVGGTAWNATCTVTFKYTVGTWSTTGTVSASVSNDRAFANSGEASGKTNSVITNSSSWSGTNGYYPGFVPDYYDDVIYYNGAWYDRSDCYWSGSAYIPYSWARPVDYYDYYYPSYSSRYDYEVEWSEDTFYYNGKTQIPTATVTIGKRTIELDVTVISGDKDSTDVGSYRARASLPSGYRGYKLDSSTLRYTIEEPLKQGLTSEDGSVYYYDDGVALTGWKTVSGDTYYFERGGKAATGWKYLDNSWYWFDSNGVMQTGWVRADGHVYYTYDSGKMAANKWIWIDGYWYYFTSNGSMAESEWVYSGGKWYYLSADGRMATNTTIPGGYRVDSTGAWVK